MENDSQTRLIVILAVGLAFVVAGAVGIFYLLPGAVKLPAADQLPPAAAAEFNLQVLDRAVYRGLDQGLIQSRQLPVRPPTGVGKANPFL